MVVFQELIICLHSSLSKGVPLTTFDDWILLLTSDNSNANTEDSGNFQEAFMKQVKYLVTPLLLMGLFLGLVFVLICLCGWSWVENSIYEIMNICILYDEDECYGFKHLRNEHCTVWFHTYHDSLDEGENGNIREIMRNKILSSVLCNILLYLLRPSSSTFLGIALWFRFFLFSLCVCVSMWFTLHPVPLFFEVFHINW